MNDPMFVAGMNDENVARCGGKGANLARLASAGFPVPPWRVLTTDAFAAALSGDKAVAEALAGLEALGQATSGGGDIKAVSDRMVSTIAACPLSDELAAVLDGIGDALDVEHVSVAVRSSAVEEDASGASFAGLHESVLFVQGRDALWKAVRQVWASAFSERALAYRLSRGLPLRDILIAVVVQQMIDPVVSGVMFTANATSGNVHELMISSLFGVGEGLVSEGLAADLFVLPKQGGETSREIAEKQERVVFAEDSGGTRTEPTPAELQNVPSLDGSQLNELRQAGLAVEKFYGTPQDIEFCYDAQGRLFLLQARPVTTVEENGPAACFRQVWDNSNIIESYSGVTSPMTFSFIRHAYTVVYHCFSQVMGIPAETVHRNRHVYERMLGLIRGQVYYNLVNWYRLIQQFPGYELNKRFMESMMGLREQFDPDDDAFGRDIGFARRWFVEAPRVLRLFARMTVRFNRLDRMVDDFSTRFAACYARWEKLDFRRCRPDELMHIYREMEDEVLWRWQAPIVNDFYVMIFYGLLKKLCTTWCGDRDGSLQNDLICGNGDIESTEPTRILMRLALRIRQDPELVRLFGGHTPEELARIVPRRSDCRDVAGILDDYLQRYGFRCVNELKLEEPSLRETPEFLYQMLQNYLAVDEASLDADAMAAREHSIRQDAETRAGEALRTRRFGWLRALIFRRVLRNARRGVRNRENMRFARTRIYGVLRELINAMGEHLAQAGLLDSSRDVYFLTIDELWDFVEGMAVTTDLRGLAELRRQEFTSHRAEDTPAPDDHFDTYGMVYWRNRFRAPAPPVAATDGALHGTGCCPGQVTAPVRIVRSPRDDLALNGCILVAGRTDPGWVPLYPAVRGILIERGSILSHSAIVAREMGIPTIVGIPNLMTSLTDGQTVTMDGQTGVVSV